MTELDQLIVYLKAIRKEAKKNKPDIDKIFAIADTALSKGN